MLFHRGNTPAPDGIAQITGDRNHLDAFATQFRDFAPDVAVDMIPLHDQHARQFVEVFRGVAARSVAISSCDVYRSYGRLIKKDTSEPENTPVTEDAPLRERMFPYRNDPPLPDDHPRKWTDIYDKIPAERIFLSDPDLPGTVLRLPMVYGPGDYQHRMWEQLQKMIAGETAIQISPVEAVWKSSRGFVDDVGAAIALAILREEAAGKVYNVAEPLSLTTTQWIEEIGAAFGWDGRLIIEGDGPQEYDLRQDLTIDTTRIRTELGFDEHTPHDEAIRRTVEWETANPPTA